MTAIQRKVTDWLSSQGGEGVILTGYKSTRIASINGQSVMCCSQNVTHGLRQSGLAIWTGRFAWKGAPIYKLTT
jgi:hypothetical protein